MPVAVRGGDLSVVDAAYLALDALGRLQGRRRARSAVVQNPGWGASAQPPAP